MLHNRGHISALPLIFSSLNRVFRAARLEAGADAVISPKDLPPHCLPGIMRGHV